MSSTCPALKVDWRPDQEGRDSQSGAQLAEHLSLCRASDVKSFEEDCIVSEEVVNTEICEFEHQKILKGSFFTGTLRGLNKYIKKDGERHKLQVASQTKGHQLHKIMAPISQESAEPLQKSLPPLMCKNQN